MCCRTFPLCPIFSGTCPVAVPPFRCSRSFSPAPLVLPFQPYPLFHLLLAQFSPCRGSHCRPFFPLCSPLLSPTFLLPHLDFVLAFTLSFLIWQMNRLSSWVLDGYADHWSGLGSSFGSLSSQNGPWSAFKWFAQISASLWTSLWAQSCIVKQLLDVWD